MHTYLVIADDTVQFDMALDYACARAKATLGAVAILRAIELQDFQDWSVVEDRIRRDLHDEAQKILWDIGFQVSERHNLTPVYYIEEGQIRDAVIKVIEADTSIIQLVLGAAPDQDSLAQYFTGKAGAKLKIPVVIVPLLLDRVRFMQGDPT